MTLRPAPSTIIMSIGLMIAATIPGRAVFDGWEWTISVWGAAVVGAVVAVVVESQRRHISTPFLPAAVALGAALWSLMVTLRDVFWDRPLSSDVWTGLNDGVFSGWGAMLVERVPLDDPVSAEVFLAALVWVASSAGIHVAERGRTAVGAIAGAGLVLGVTTAAALSQELTPAIFGAAAGAATLMLISTITRAPEQKWRTGRVAGLLAVVAGASLIATAGGTASEALEREPLDPRTSQVTETVELQIPDLLAQYSERLGADTVDFTIETAGTQAGHRLRLQVFEEHTGERWRPNAEFARVATFPESDDLPPGSVVDLTITIGDLESPWLPLPDRVIATDVRDLRWNEDTTTILRDPLPETYQVRGSAVARDAAVGIELVTPDVAGPLAEAEGLPDSIRDLAAEITADAADPVASIDAITSYLRSLGRNEAVAPGNSFGRLRDDLIAERPLAAEQMASAHALMLRAVGIPSRVVVGYLTTELVVTSNDLTVWVEVLFDGVGWVPFDPVPILVETDDAVDDLGTATSTTLAGDAALRAQATARELEPGENADQLATGDRDEFSGLDALILIAALTVAVVLLLVLVRFIRRRTRLSPSRRTTDRVLGAWAEAVDRLRETGAPIESLTTVRDAVDHASNIAPEVGDSMQELADLVNVAFHAPAIPTAEQADEALATLHEVEQAVTAATGRPSIAKRFVDPRVLRYRVPRPPPHRKGGRRSELSSR